MAVVPRGGAPTPARFVELLIAASENPKIPGKAKSAYTRIWTRCRNANSGSTMYSCTELADEIGVARTSISRHLDKLRDAGVLRTTDCGPNGLLLDIIGYFEPESQQAFEFLESGRENVTSHVPLPLEADANVRPLYAKSVEPLSPDPYPAREYYIAPSPLPENSAALPDDDAMVVVQKLTQLGITASVVPDLVRRLPQRCEAWSKALEYLDPGLKNPAGWVRKAIELDYALPPKYLAMLRRSAKERERQNRLTEPQLQLQAEFENHKLLESLPADVLYTIKLQVDEKLSTGMLSRLGPMIKGSVRDGMILEAARLARFGDHGAVA